MSTIRLGKRGDDHGRHGRRPGSMNKYTVGDRLLASTPYGRGRVPEPVVVVAVGRKYVTVRREGFEFSHSDRKFDMATGDEFIRGGYLGGTLYTQAEWNELEECSHLLTHLRELGVSFYSARGLRAADLRAIETIVDEAARR